MKKVRALFLSGLLIAGLTACGNTKTENTVVDSVAEITTESITAESITAGNNVTESVTSESIAAGTAADESTGALESTDKTTESGNKILVVYYSASGNTERAANNIADALNADTFELVPENPYTSEDLDWTKDGSRVNQEHDDQSLRNIPLVQDTVENWEEYDTVFIGYPIWWGIAAWPVNEFVENNDFTGKTVIPFATSASSGIGESGTLLEEMAGTGDWQEGKRFSSGVSESDITSWIESLGL